MNIPNYPPPPSGPPDPLPPYQGGQHIEHIMTCKTCHLPVTCSYCASLSSTEHSILEQLRLFATYYTALISFSQTHKSQMSRCEQSPQKEGEL